MSSMGSWTFSVIAVLALVLALHHLGVNAGASLSTVVRGAEHFLGQPLLPS